MNFLCFPRSSMELEKEFLLRIRERTRNKAIEIAKNLLDILDDQTISQKTELSIKNIKS